MSRNDKEMREVEELERWERAQKIKAEKSHAAANRWLRQEIGKALARNGKPVPAHLAPSAGEARDLIVTAAEVEAKRAELEAAGLASGNKSLAKALSVSVSTIRRRRAEAE